MKYFKIMLGLVLLFSHITSYAQLSTHELPVSFDSSLKLKVISKSLTSSVVTPTLDMKKIKAEDEKEGKDIPPRFGYPHKVDLNTSNSGTWFELPSGDKLWQLNVSCPGAKSINLLYDKFWIPEGGKFFLYTKNRKQSIGAFTSKNNKGGKNSIRGFATELLYGDEVTLEYYQPKEVTDTAIISIDRIVHGYKSLRDDESVYGQSGSCQVNVNCSEGIDWQNEKKAIALILVNGNRHASGALTNITDMNAEPYFLTANHALIIGKDAEGDSILDTYSFYWNYETAGCDNITVEPVPYTTVGAVVVANKDNPDFALFRLTEDPKDISGYTPYYLGWDRSGNAGSPGVCIHHPLGDVKKISTVALQPFTTTHNYYDHYWGVNWKSTVNGHGVTNNGSSGSPLLNGEHREIGVLKGGESSCTWPNATDFFTKFDFVWTNDNAINIHQRLDYWLDSHNTGIEVLDGLMIVPGNTVLNAANNLYSNIRIFSTGQLTISNQIQLIGNGKVIVDAGGKVVIDGGKLSNADIVLKPGATLNITNGGILECQNDFVAPVGATVNIINGEIRH